MKISQTFLLFFLFVYTGSHAQTPLLSTADIQDNPEWTHVDSLPNRLLEKNAVGYYFRSDMETGDLSFYREDKKLRLVLVKSFGNEIIYNTAKTGGAIYRDGYIRLCSEMPFRATVFCYLFSWDGKKLEMTDEEVSDESARLLELGDSLLNEGDITGALDAYNSMMYPMSYMDKTQKALEILEKAAPLAHNAYQNEKYTEAVEILGPVFGFYGAWRLGEQGFENPDALLEYQTGYEIPMTDYLKTHSTDYGLYLYKAGRLDEAVSWNTYLAKILPDYPNPCLQWADALYDQGKPTEAQEAYRQYQQRMEQAGRSNQIPQRVYQRLKN